MNYATTCHQNTALTEGSRFIPTIAKLCGLPQKTEDRRRDQKGQAKGRSDSHVANGIIGKQFLPKLHGCTILQDCKRPKKMERDLKQSLSQLAKHYQIEIMPLNGLGFPYNMALAFADVDEKLNGVPHWDAIQVVREEGGKTFLVSQEHYNTNATIYYIPVVPLYRLCRDKKRRKNYLLLLSVFAYLYQVADIPYYRDESSYLFYQYDMLQDWVSCDDEESDCRGLYENDFKIASWAGDVVKHKIANPENLRLFKERIDAFKPQDASDEDCLKVALEAHRLYTDFPEATVRANIPEDNGDEDEEILRMEQYISFCADFDGVLSDQLFDTINCEFNEYRIVEEPTTIKKFDGTSPIPKDSFAFESRLFKLIDKLVSLLNNN